jgi:hypothetical protein
MEITRLVSASASNPHARLGLITMLFPLISKSTAMIRCALYGMVKKIAH